jgi:hypothetical protein
VLCIIWYLSVVTRLRFEQRTTTQLGARREEEKGMVWCPHHGPFLSPPRHIPRPLGRCVVARIVATRIGTWVHAHHRWSRDGEAVWQAQFAVERATRSVSFSFHSGSAGLPRVNVMFTFLVSSNVGLNTVNIPRARDPRDQSDAHEFQRVLLT